MNNTSVTREALYAAYSCGALEYSDLVSELKGAQTCEA